MSNLSDHVTVDPWAHQEDAFQWIAPKPFAGLLSSMGTGKSLVAIGLIGEWGNNRNLIVCPTSMFDVWRREIEKFADYPVQTFVLSGKLQDRCMVLSANAYNGDVPRIFIINYEALTYKQVVDWLDWASFETIILDESHRIKTPSAQTTKAAIRISRYADRKLIMTGTPAADKPTDVFMQMRFLSTQIFGNAFGPFFEKYVIYKPMMAANGGRYKEILGYRDLDEMGNIIDKHSFRVPKEVLNLIPTLPPQIIPIQLGDKAVVAYRKMLKESLVQLEEGEVAATNVLTRMLRLQEITSGYLRTDPDPEEPQRTTKIIDNAKLEAVGDLIDSFDPLEPVVVFYNFKIDGTRIGDKVRTMGRPIYFLNGNTNDLERWKRDRNRGPVLAAQLRSGNAGISMVESCKVIYYSHTFSLTTFEQSLSRTDRPGQNNAVTYYHLVAPNTIDDALLQALQNKKVTAEILLESVRAMKDNV